MSANPAAEITPRVSRLLQYLEADPGNLRLVEDAASAAFEDGAVDLAHQLIKHRATTAALSPSLSNLSGLVAITLGRYEEAIATFEDLRKADCNNPHLRFNLAWAKAMKADYQGALDLLTDDALSVSPQAPALKVQMMHHLGLYDEALAVGETLAKRFPTDLALMGSLAVLAMDAERIDLAELYAERGGDHGDAQAVRGMLALVNHDIAGASTLFDQALNQRADNARAWIGKGLSQLVTGDIPAGAKAIDRGAELFKTHIGSWVVSGWAHFIAGEYEAARASFDRALAIDDCFAESHGGLAVIDVVQGRDAEAARRCEIALRLDRKCFGAALGKILLLQKGGRTEAARKIRDIALSTPAGPNGETLAQALISFGFGKPN
jgi:tetratricopeptide (TPR) repeat protein